MCAFVVRSHNGERSASQYSVIGPHPSLPKENRGQPGDMPSKISIPEHKEGLSPGLPSNAAFPSSLS